MSETVPFTNTAPRLYQIAGKDFKPGETHHLDPVMAEKLRKKPAVTSGHLQEGRVEMPTPRRAPKPAVLPDDLARALAYIRAEDDLAVLHTWTTAETSGAKRPEILTSLGDRAKILAK